jgi:hypothetical protein
MPADDEKFPLPERIFLAFTAVARWAGRGVTAPPNGTGGTKSTNATDATVGTSASGGTVGRRGCAHPLTLIKVAVFLFVILLFPLFVLPMLAVRLAQLGRTGFRYSTSVDVASGDRARWAHGTLPPAPGIAVVSAGTAAIASRDPGFRAAALTDWAVAASALLCQSLVTGDATCTRTFMANGLFDAHQALLELRARDHVSCAGAWQAVGTAVVGVSRSPLTEQMRVRVSCQGWCWERHQPTGITLRGGPDGTTWSEDLAFARSATAITPPGGGLPASRCPSCGAHLDLDPGGACRYCRGVVTAGHHDWVLVSWQREPW